MVPDIWLTLYNFDAYRVDAYKFCSYFQGAEDGDVSDNVSTVADDFVAPKTTILIEENNENKENETGSVKSCVLTTGGQLSGQNAKKPNQPRLNRAHSCGSLFSLKERALLRQKLSSHVTAAFWDILSTTNAVTSAAADLNFAAKTATSTEVNAKKQQDLTLALKSNPLAVFQLQSTSRCCNLC